MQATQSLNEFFHARGLITTEELQARQQYQQELERQYEKDLEAARQLGKTFMIGGLELFWQE